MPTKNKDLYEVLGVDRNADISDIKKAYRHKARKLHPDVNHTPTAEEDFKELNEAYDVLSDPSKRAQYDRFGTIPGAAAGSAGSGFVDFADIFEGFGGMGDIFSSFFGGAGRHQATVRREGRDMGIGIDVTLEQVASGYKRDIVYDRLAPCTDCDGTGVGEGGKEIDCPECGGTGRVVSVTRTFLGDMQSSSTCNACGGTGKKIEGACEECHGEGRVPDRQHVSIEIPPGIKDGQQLRVSDYGEAGMNGAPGGDLIVTVRVQPHELFERNGDDLHASISVSMLQAALGATMNVDGIMEDEQVKIKIPSGSQNGDVIRVKGYGLPRFGRDSRGDLIVHLSVEIPKKLTKAQKKVLKDLAADMGDDLSSKKASFEKIREV